MMPSTSFRCARRAGLTALACALGALVLAPAATAAPPPNDAFADAQPLIGISVSITASNVDATLEPGEPLADWDADASVWYTWTSPAAGAYQIDTCGSGIDTVLGVFTGTTLAGLTWVAASDDGCGRASLAQFRAAAGVGYRIAVAGYGGDQGAFHLAISSVPPPPNDNFVAAQVLTGGSWEVAGSAIAATSELGEPAHGGLPAARTVWFRWVAPVGGRYELFVGGNVRLGLYTGGSLATLAPVPASYDIEEGDLRFTSTPGTEYRIAVNWSEPEPYPTDGRFDLYADSDALAITPATVDFGAQAISTMSASKAVTLRPIGGLMDVPPHAVIRGPHAADFIKISDDDDSCTGGVCMLIVRFAPSEAGPRTAALVVGTWLGSYNVPLTGIGTPVTSVQPTPPLTPTPPAPQAAPTGTGSCKLIRNTRRGAAVQCRVIRSPAANGTVTGVLQRGTATKARGRAKLLAGKATLLLKTTRKLARGRYRASLSIAVAGAPRLTLTRTLTVR
jgi:hypothetical protein